MNNLSNSCAGQQQKILEKWSLLKRCGRITTFWETVRIHKVNIQIFVILSLSVNIIIKVLLSQRRLYTSWKLIQNGCMALRHHCIWNRLQWKLLHRLRTCFKNHCQWIQFISASTNVSQNSIIQRQNQTGTNKIQKHCCLLWAQAYFAWTAAEWKLSCGLMNQNSFLDTSSSRLTWREEPSGLLLAHNLKSQNLWWYEGALMLMA